jgi:hypothetical protein
MRAGESASMCQRIFAQPAPAMWITPIYLMLFSWPQSLLLPIDNLINQQARQSSKYANHCPAISFGTVGK